MSLGLKISGSDYDQKQKIRCSTPLYKQFATSAFQPFSSLSDLVYRKYHNFRLDNKLNVSKALVRDFLYSSVEHLSFSKKKKTTTNNKVATIFNNLLNILKERQIYRERLNYIQVNLCFTVRDVDIKEIYLYRIDSHVSVFLISQNAFVRCKKLPDVYKRQE